MQSVNELALRLVDRIASVSTLADEPFVVAIDGRSGVGKSTLAAAAAAILNSDSEVATVIEGDQFYSGGSSTTWDSRSAAEKAAGVIDWNRQRAVLQQLRSGRDATFRSFDWTAPDWDADEVPLEAEPTLAKSSPIVIVEGAYSARPELADLLDLRVLLEAPTEVRRQQLLDREGEGYRDDWERRWSEAEDRYFGTVMPHDQFDLTLGKTEI